MQKVNTEIKSVLRDILNCKEIDTKIMDYLLMKRPQLGRFYLLSKIYKRTSNVPRKPIIANIWYWKWYWNRKYSWFSWFLPQNHCSVVLTVLHILQDTRDFSSRLNELCEIPKNAYLVSFDVVGLHPHIPHERGLEILKYFLDKREDQLVSSENLCRLANIILKHNYFELGSDKYHQLLGTAIGTKFAPNYVNIFMVGLEEN